MKGSLKIVKIFGIDIDIHFTFLILLFFFAALMGVKGILLISGIFFFVTMHEMCHSLAALRFGIKVRRITLLPIGGVASIEEVPKKPYQELIISLAGPLSNVAVLIVFYYPLRALLGEESFLYPLRMLMRQAQYSSDISILAYVYWVNLVLAVFNLIPAFPMDGGRILRAVLSYRMEHKEATAVAVRLGHIFALLFGYLGIVYGHIFLIVIAVFIYMAASSEAVQTDLAEAVKRYTVRDVIPEKFISIEGNTPLSKVLEFIFHSHQEDFPVMSGYHMEGIITRREIIKALHETGKETLAGDIMRTDITPVDITAGLDVVQKEMQKHNTRAIPVEKDGKIAGVVTVEDINRVYLMA